MRSLSGVSQAVKRPNHIGQRPQQRGLNMATQRNRGPLYGLDASVQFCARLKLFKRLILIFLQLKKTSPGDNTLTRIPAP